MKRTQEQKIINDLEKKMVLIAGPRQAGKTWLAKKIAQKFSSSVYLNYDQFEDRTIIHQQNWPHKTDLLVLDELHKMPQWKNYLKGLYDTKAKHLRIIVTGSAKLDIYQKVGDSLAGRYFLHHLLPLSPAELKQTGQPIELDRLISRSGFPEPYLADNETDAERWRMQYNQALIREDVLDFTQIANVRAMQTVFDLLRSRVGSPVSYNSISEDVAISPHTVKKYIEILETLYVIFKVTPYSKNIARSLLKEPKVYFFDTGLVNGNPGIKFENLIANCLLKHMYAKIDYEAKPYSVNYLRTRDGKEVDFVLTKNNQAIQLIEAKLTNHQTNATLNYFNKKYQVPAVQLVKELRHETQVGDIMYLKAQGFLENLML